MAPACKMPLPPGKIGITFKGTPPVVKRVSEDSPLAGKVKEGFVFVALYLQDGTEFQGLSTNELVSTLGEYSEEQGRKIRFKMGLPDSTTVTVPPGEITATIEGDPPKLTKMSPESPLYSKVRIGLAVDSISLEDGTSMSGYSTDEILEVLKDNENQDRTIKLVNPATTSLSPRSYTPPMMKEVELPTGKIGAVFKGSRALISRLTAESPVRDSFRLDMVADTLVLPDGTEYAGLSPGDMAAALGASADITGRKMVLKSKTNKTLAKQPTTKVLLPKGGKTKLGLVFRGEPAMIIEVKEDSPLAGKVRAGHELATIQLEDGMEYDDLDTEEAYEVLDETFLSEGRAMVLINKPAPIIMPDEKEVKLPAGKIGVVFKGTPPMIKSIKDDSPVKDEVMEGMVVDVLTLEDGEQLCEMSTQELTFELNYAIESEGRVLLLKNPETAEMTKKEAKPIPDYTEVTLPAGKLGVTFKGKPPMVTSINRDSSVRKELVEGMVVDSLTVEATKFIDMDVRKLVNILAKSFDSEERVMVLKNPETQEISTMPDTMEVVLPAGKLGVSFKGSPPTVSKLSPESPVKDELLAGMAVDMLTYEDGTVMSGMSTQELVSALSESADSEGRTLTLKNPAVKAMSTKQLILPDEKDITLPAGKLGISFKGTPPIVSRLHDDSPMKGIVRVGMVVDTLDIPGEEGGHFAGLTAKELVGLLADSKDVEGREIVLKNPATATLSERAWALAEATSFADEDSQISQRY
jgi:hypothetical protein